MIKVEDLRFGSVLQIEDQIITVGIIDEDFISWKYNIKDRSFWNPYISLKDERLKPIEISEEILLKCGFEKGYTKGVFKLGDFTIDLYSQTWKFKREWIDINFKYLHQLQNLYWCLCGKELNVDRL